MRTSLFQKMFGSPACAPHYTKKNEDQHTFGAPENYEGKYELVDRARRVLKNSYSLRDPFSEITLGQIRMFTPEAQKVKLLNARIGRRRSEQSRCDEFPLWEECVSDLFLLCACVGIVFEYIA